MEPPPALIDLGVALVGLWVLWHYGLKPHIAKRFRFRLTQFHVELSALIQKGHVDPQSDAYSVIRDLLDGYKSTNGEVSVMKALVPLMLVGFPPSKSVGKKMDLVYEILEGDRGSFDLQDYTRRFMMTAGKFILARSLVTISLLLVLSPAIFISLVVYTAMQKLSWQEIGTPLSWPNWFRYIHAVTTLAEIRISTQAQPKRTRAG